MMDFDKIIETYGDNLLRLCTLYLKDSKLAEDAVQETFIRVWKNQGTFQNKSHLKTWITRIAINVCKSYLRTPWSKMKFTSKIEEIVQGSVELGENSDQTLLTSIMELPVKYREIILLYYYQELTIDEISEILHMNASTVGVRLKRGREKLEPMLRGWYYGE